MIKFEEKSHSYTDVTDGTKYTSVTTVLGKMKKPFDNSIADANVKDPESKWYQMNADTVREIWKAEALRSTTLGSWYHHKKEWSEVNAIRCVESDGWKYAMSQQLLDGIYPEFITYHQEYQVAGQIDRLVIKDNKISIDDYKSSKEIKMKSWNGRKMLLYPVQHLQDCHHMHYSLQLSMYAYMVKAHNNWLDVGQLNIKHIKFQIKELDKYGYPILALDNNGDYIVEEVINIPCPYLEKECIAILEYHKTKSLPIKAG